MQNKCITAQFIAPPRVHLVHWSRPELVPTAFCTIQYMLMWSVGFHVRTSMFSWSLKEEFSIVAKLFELFISLCGMCCKWNQKVPPLGYDWNNKSQAIMFEKSCFLLVFFCIFHSPEEVWCSNNHVLEVLKRQTSIIVQVSLIYDFFTNHRHLFLGQLVPCQFVEGLLQVGDRKSVV